MQGGCQCVGGNFTTVSHIFRSLLQVGPETQKYKTLVLLVALYQISLVGLADMINSLAWYCKPLTFQPYIYFISPHLNYINQRPRLR